MGLSLRVPRKGIHDPEGRPIPTRATRRSATSRSGSRFPVCRTRRRDCGGGPGRRACAAAGRPSRRASVAEDGAARPGHPRPGRRPRRRRPGAGAASGPLGVGRHHPVVPRAAGSRRAGGAVHDLRLCHAVLRRSVRQPGPARRRGRRGWDALPPVIAADPALFPLDEPATCSTRSPSTAAAAALAARAERGRLGLLLAAESAGALVAAEMTTPGCPGAPTCTSGC